MPETLKLEIVTPEAKAYSEDVEMVTLPGVDGELGVYPQHVPLMTQIVPGELTVHKDGKESYIAVGEGFVEVTANRVAILTDMAMSADQIDESQVEEARKRAQARLAGSGNDEEAAAAQASLARSIALINVKRHKHR